MSLRFRSAKKPLESEVSEVAESIGPETHAIDALIVYLQSTVNFPSWTSRFGSRVFEHRSRPSRTTRLCCEHKHPPVTARGFTGLLPVTACAERDRPCCSPGLAGIGFTATSRPVLVSAQCRLAVPLRAQRCRHQTASERGVSCVKPGSNCLRTSGHPLPVHRNFKFIFPILSII